MSLGKGLDIVGVAQALLDAIVQHYAAASNTASLPERRCLAAGEPRSIAWDCEQLIVATEGIGFGPIQDASADSRRVGSPIAALSTRHVVLVVQLVRCVPGVNTDGTPPTMADINTAGVQFLRDMGLISQATTRFAAELGTQLGDTASVLPGVADPVGPTGNMAAVETTLGITVMELA